MDSRRPCICGRREENNPICICSSFPEQSDQIIHALVDTSVDIDEKIPLLLDGPNGDGGKVPNVRIRREGIITLITLFIDNELK